MSLPKLKKWFALRLPNFCSHRPNAASPPALAWPMVFVGLRRDMTGE
jgi:hypothetical protein